MEKLKNMPTGTKFKLKHQEWMKTSRKHNVYNSFLCVALNNTLQFNIGDTAYFHSEDEFKVID